MKRILTARQMRWADQQTVARGTPGGMLMERVGRAVASAVLQCRPDSGRIVIVVGSGNNGGDGYAAARVLAGQNIQVTVISLSDPEGLEG
ncbi:MAG: NAD(P)H-hydrate epimerase, partial [Mariprofundaceae bacterium]|nr:NAD(P)H-hydrate epimerase [Mariprofundaceae bacterium]